MRRRIPRERAKLAPPRALSSAEAAREPVLDERWRGDMCLAWCCSAVFLAMLFALDGYAGTLNAVRAVAWVGLGVLLFLALVPPRVMAGPGWLASRWLWRERLVRTDRLASARWAEGGAQRLVLRDTDGGRVEVDPDVLATNPALWHLVDEGARTSLEQRWLCRGEGVLRQLSRRIDEQTALAIFKVSGLDENDQP